MSLEHKRAAFVRGTAAEQAAVDFLARQGFGVLARRARTKAGEIDLIMGDDRLLLFIEVKARRSLDDAAFALSPAQRRRIAAGAEVWLAENPQAADMDMRFDVVLVSSTGAIRHLPAAFEMES